MTRPDEVIEQRACEFFDRFRGDHMVGMDPSEILEFYEEALENGDMTLDEVLSKLL